MFVIRYKLLMVEQMIILQVLETIYIYNVVDVLYGLIRNFKQIKYLNEYFNA